MTSWLVSLSVLPLPAPPPEDLPEIPEMPVIDLRTWVCNFGNSVGNLGDLVVNLGNFGSFGENF